jgi:hypothetical protein
MGVAQDAGFAAHIADLLGIRDADCIGITVGAIAALGTDRPAGIAAAAASSGADRFGADSKMLSTSTRSSRRHVHNRSRNHSNP